MRLTAIILAAGLGIRMKSSIPKVLHKIYDKPIIHYIIETLHQLQPEKIIIVINEDSHILRNSLENTFPSLTFAIQQDQKGTADALKAGISQLKDFQGIVLVVNGDTPFISLQTLRNLLDLNKSNSEDISFVSFIAKNPEGYGRVIRRDGRVIKIVEEKNATKKQKEIQEVNSGIYAIKSSLLELLNYIKIDPKKGEYFLTDLVEIAASKGYRVGAHNIANEEELIGINTREDLHLALHYLKKRIAKTWLSNGVTILDINTAFIHPDVQIGRDTVIYPNVFLEGRTIIGQDCKIYSNTRILNSVLGNNVFIKDCCVIESAQIMDGTIIGPFAHIRPDSIIGPMSKVGNFVEIKKSVLGRGVKASHLSYLGDSEIGNNVNIGAGTITCNYDGRSKYKTTIEDDVFVGSDTQLVAPVRVGRGAYIGSGSTITKDVPAGSLAVSRAKQKNIEGWVYRKRKQK
ncbi:MAG: bifunctional UDP-N-acetylglucosamine diphosphorylase/glucosamine-1-phosphate N-acetyltransferase GlmU [Thermodesulfovibrionales bacterium]|nr:bifunctional UDP-N-acetylglucosamine diphosphorylase/glucosamine-1-phosphate N-acetyltransferase GlmU [Thermodesulfovibrionales bacterium]